MLTTPEGKWVLFHPDTGTQLERWPVDAKLLVANGEYVLEPPEGVEPVIPAPPPRHVAVPKAATVSMPEAVEKTAAAKKAKAEAA